METQHQTNADRYFPEQARHVRSILESAYGAGMTVALVDPLRLAARRNTWT